MKERLGRNAQSRRQSTDEGAGSGGLWDESEGGSRRSGIFYRGRRRRRYCERRLMEDESPMGERTGEEKERKGNQKIIGRVAWVDA